MVKHCRILTKCSAVPKQLQQFLRPSDVLFSWTEAFIVCDDEDFLDTPYQYELPIELIRIDKRVLQDLDDPELAVLFFRAKIEREAQIICGDEDIAIQNADMILLKRYPKVLLESIDQKLQAIFGGEEDG